MRTVLFLGLLFTSCFRVWAHADGSYLPAQKKQLDSKKLGTRVDFELILPDTNFTANGQTFPVIYLLDAQNTVNYTYNLSTIQYLTDLGEIPQCLVVGIPFDPAVRNSWTNPDQTGGRATDFINFLSIELDSVLTGLYHAAPLKILVGHSRTAILASYALSVNPAYFSAAVCSSSAYFDFGDTLQKMQFEKFLTTINGQVKKYHYYFSAGSEQYGDLHEASVKEMEQYLNAHSNLPDNFYWSVLYENGGHNSTPGFTLNHALLDLFSPYRLALQSCFELVKDSAFSTHVPVDLFQSVYQNASVEMGYTVKPDLLFYNSIASAYANDYQGYFGAEKNTLCLAVLMQAVADFPDSYEFYAWMAELQFEQNQVAAGEKSIAEAKRLIKQSASLSKAEKKEWNKYLDTLAPTN
ncbi:MAG: hypothetical protein HYZ14_04100 [Bacteroidetes bacterium]|nr:hypothetical protein [Bacteroidota bacterium]